MQACVRLGDGECSEKNERKRKRKLQVGVFCFVFGLVGSSCPRFFILGTFLCILLHARSLRPPGDKPTFFFFAFNPPADGEK